jgi:hypothetical protein
MENLHGIQKTIDAEIEIYAGYKPDEVFHSRQLTGIQPVES